MCMPFCVDKMIRFDGSFKEIICLWRLKTINVDLWCINFITTNYFMHFYCGKVGEHTDVDSPWHLSFSTQWRVPWQVFVTPISRASHVYVMEKYCAILRHHMELGTPSNPTGLVTSIAWRKFQWNIVTWEHLVTHWVWSTSMVLLHAWSCDMYWNFAGNFTPLHTGRWFDWICRLNTALVFVICHFMASRWLQLHLQFILPNVSACFLVQFFATIFSVMSRHWFWNIHLVAATIHSLAQIWWEFPTKTLIPNYLFLRLFTGLVVNW